jgi:hypothetical protein
MEFDLEKRTILLVRAGSRAYGTSRPDSDVDVRGVAVSPQSYRDGFVRHFEQADKKSEVAVFQKYLSPEEQEITAVDGLDGVIFDIRKYMPLASECNPNVLESLFVDKADVLLVTPGGELLREHREAFLSQRALHRFRGYAFAQLKRIKLHRNWLLNPPTHQPTRAEYDLPERTVIPADQLAAAQAEVKKKVDSWEIDFSGLGEAEVLYIQEQMHNHLTEIHVGKEEKFDIAARLLGYSTNFIKLLDQERRYQAAQTAWKQYQEWKENRNEKRSELEKKHGYDTKHASHLVRLLHMCREILTEGKFLVRRPNAKDLLAIRDGAWTYDQLLEWAEREDADLIDLARSTNLPRSPDMKFLDALCQEVVGTLPAG